MIEDEGLSDRMTMRIGDATNIDLPDASFTKVLAIECAFHFNTREDFFREAFRVLKPGGMLAIADPTVADDIGDLPIEERRDCVAHDARMICDENLYGPSTFKSKLEAVGFGPVRIESIKEHVLEPFANHLERVAATSEPELRERRLIAVERIRKNHCRGGDYVIATAVKAARLTPAPRRTDRAKGRPWASGSPVSNRSAARRWPASRSVSSASGSGCTPMRWRSSSVHWNTIRGWRWGT